MDLKKAVRIAAIMKDTTQTEVGEKAGITSANMSTMMNRGTCSIPNLIKIAAALDMKVSELIKLGE